jgi:hypothetical protein
MSHEHKHDQHHHHGPEGGTPPRNRPIHHRWQFWVAVILMLVGMGVYVMTMDESLQPGGQVGPPVPAAP